LYILLLIIKKYKMRKAGLIIVTSVFFALALSSCGSSYTPMTEEQISSKADSIFNVQKETLTQQANEACAQGMEASVAARVEEKKANAATAATTK
jgi:hypothetical protein